ncbi:neurotoxin-associated TULIP family protein P47 [Clostridium botulinum]|uniref:p-47 protein n=4 Tax=Clostridium botulinum TaxID=1491 RepID=P71115_CLOBO|nr:neurotoxin-associated TULIP family protein P47 [Clostridium botulinum]AJA05785.1 neurotoxin complex component p47 [Clostridium botulinum A]ABS39418.1 P-47 protein [Clostridium botulinum F str. Langeland]ADF98588.1 P-47 protein [Clostridium botulinum F str. 230613]KKM40126.1 P-47 protein [Clostridium botulinum]MBY6791856.1 neurotoxin-associated TULIP family protein P47 [Clostridium botulinum]
MNTYGWDIVYGCSKRVVNKHLKDYITKNKVEFLYSNTDKKQEIKMVFDNWEIINGGSSNFLRIKTPIKEGYFKVKNTTIDLSGVNPVLEIKLDFFNDISDPNIKKLKFNFGSESNDDIKIIVSDLNGKLQEEDEFYFNKLLINAFIQNEKQISYIFASLNVTSDIEWMNPKQFKFVYYSPTDNSDGYLFILSVVTNRDISELSVNVDGNILGNNSEVGLLISEKLFLKNLVLPKLSSNMGSDITSNNFKVISTSDTTGRIANNSTLNWYGIKVGLIWYYPKINNFSMELFEGNKLKTKLSGIVRLTGYERIYSELNLECTTKFIYDPKNKKTSFEYYKTSIMSCRPIFGLLDGVPALVAKSVGDWSLKSFRNSLAFGLTNNFTDIINGIVRWNNLKISEVTNVTLNVGFCIQGNAN